MQTAPEEGQVTIKLSLQEGEPLEQKGTSPELELDELEEEELDEEELDEEELDEEELDEEEHSPL